MQPLNYREWLEQIVATGSQRSGFADDTLRALDSLAEYEQISEDLYDGLAHHGVLVGSDEDIANVVNDQIGAYQQVISLLVDAGVLDGDAHVTGDQVLGLLRMFLPV